ncbi:hypothetical protein TanjilG_27314 [Lupinus angustifolius]|uniref:Uncharacterized protein n=1 Tax=Lupinus angustifolius TaxID=3871 RepID=A0A1J7FMU6_LUPAN|nr:hypothetical protein TanjilG_23751 [Lupinus angustifolius]OIW19775.1 hypothetical protein TanjilG_27314 [Lupinus angustifolius]
MGSEAPSWAEQWGAGGIGAMEDDDTKNKNSGAKSGLTKAKASASNCLKLCVHFCFSTMVDTSFN